MRPTLVQLPSHSSKPPHSCVVTGRTDGDVVDFGKDYIGIDPHIYIWGDKVEEAAELLGMVRESRVKELEAELEEANAEAGRLRAIVAGKEALSDAEEKLREALEAPKP